MQYIELQEEYLLVNAKILHKQVNNNNRGLTENGNKPQFVALKRYLLYNCTPEDFSSLVLQVLLYLQV